MSIEVMKRLVAAVEAIPEEVEGWMPDALTDALIDAKKAIAEAEKQEPVAWRPALTYEGYAEQGPWNTGKPSGNDIVYWDNEGGVGIEYAYTHPQPKREPLTDDEIWKFWWNKPEVPEGEDDSMEAQFVAAVRAVLAAHGIKGEA